METLILSAASFEAVPLLTALSQQDQTYRYESVGIGPLEAAARATEIFTSLAPSKILFVGTCGIFGRADPPLVVRAMRTYWWPTCARHGLSALIEGIDPPLDLPAPPPELQGFAPAAVLCSPGITLTDRPGELPEMPTNTENQTEILVENLELYSVLRAYLRGINGGSRFCSSEVPLHEFGALLAVTNTVGPNGRKEWKKNYKDAAEWTAEQYISAAAPAFPGERSPLHQ